MRFNEIRTEERFRNHIFWALGKVRAIFCRIGAVSPVTSAVHCFCSLKPLGPWLLGRGARCVCVCTAQSSAHSHLHSVASGGLHLSSCPSRRGRNSLALAFVNGHLRESLVCNTVQEVRRSDAGHVCECGSSPSPCLQFRMCVVDAR